MLKGLLAFIAGLVILTGIVIGIPVLIIWALNTVFALMIPYTWQTILATLVLTATFMPKDVKYKSDEF